ncbi:MAG: D-alanyl-D-alanine carboxypeptidase family protein [Acutalibacteraceae bacterium]|nr:D-alanyl-D-alanine carboxypeptidase family protein [Acutalibacteraceae bacterium]
MFYKRIIAFALSLTFILPFTVYADIGSNNVNYDNIVTEYYSDDLYEDIVETATIPMASVPEIKAKSAILIEASTGDIIYKKDEDLKLPPASITKIMTMLLIIEAIENKKVSFYDKVTASEHAASMGGSQIWLEVGETMTVHDLLKAVAVGSANDASVALAEHIAGSEEGFVSMMNQRAKELGMKNTNFANACGLDDDNLYTTAKDVAIMSRELISHDVIKQYTTIWMDTVRNETVQLVNTNKLVRFYRGATGLKTGTTNGAGCCLSATAKRDGMELIAVIMGAESSNERFSNAKKLLDYGFANLCLFKTSEKVDYIKSINVNKGQKKKVKLKYDKIVNELLKTENKSNIKVITETPKTIDAPVKKNQKIGTVKVKLDDKVIRKYNIYASEEIKKINFGFCFCKLLKSMTEL